MVRTTLPARSPWNYSPAGQTLWLLHALGRALAWEAIGEVEDAAWWWEQTRAVLHG